MARPAAPEDAAPEDAPDQDAATAALHQQWGKRAPTSGYVRNLVRRGDLATLQQLVQFDPDILHRHAFVCTIAAENNHIELLHWVRAQGCPWTAETSSRAAGAGRLAVLQWAHAHGCPWDATTCSEAARCGHLAVLQWAHANGCPMNAWTCTNAAIGARLEILQWAQANGCPWNANTCTWAARCGHLEILQWARAHGCPWNARTCDSAAAAGDNDTITLGNGTKSWTFMLSRITANTCSRNGYARTDVPNTPNRPCRRGSF